MSLHGEVDEAPPPNDDDYIYAFSGSAGTCELGFSDPADEPGDGEHILRVRIRALSSGGLSETLAVTLKQGSTTVATRNLAATTAGWATHAITLTSGEVENISDYSALSIALQYTTLSSFELAGVSWIELEVPDAPPEPGPHVVYERLRSPLRDGASFRSPIRDGFTFDGSLT